MMMKYIVLLALLLTASFGIVHAQSQTSKLFIQDIRWSPDGKQMLFSAFIGKSDWSDFNPTKWGLYEIYLPTKNIYRISKSASTGSYGPNRRFIAYSKYFGTVWKIVLDNVATGDTTILTSGASNNRAPSFSPNGTQIIFMSDRDGSNELYMMNRDGSDQRRLTYSKEGKPFNPEWSPFGKNITFYLEKGDHKDQIYVMNLDKVLPENITNDDANNIYPGWTPDGSIVYSSTFEDDKPKAYTISPDGTQKKELLGISSNFVRYSPDGTKIAFITKSDDGSNVTVMNPNGTQAQQLIDLKVFMGIFK